MSTVCIFSSLARWVRFMIPAFPFSIEHCMQQSCCGHPFVLLGVSGLGSRQWSIQGYADFLFDQNAWVFRSLWRLFLVSSIEILLDRCLMRVGNWLDARGPIMNVISIILTHGLCRQSIHDAIVLSKSRVDLLEYEMTAAVIGRSEVSHPSRLFRASAEVRPNVSSTRLTPRSLLVLPCFRPPIVVVEELATRGRQAA